MLLSILYCNYQPNFYVDQAAKYIHPPFSLSLPEDIPGSACTAFVFPSPPIPNVQFLTFDAGVCQPNAVPYYCGPPDKKRLVDAADCKPTCAGPGSGPFGPNPLKNYCCVELSSQRVVPTFPN